jgi:hypothetical protein
VKRVTHWEAALAEWQQASINRSFEWGVFDCALATCDAVMALTGVDPGMAFRRTYSTEAEAMKLLGTEGLGEFAASIARQCGMVEVPPLFAHRGDVVLVDNLNPGQALGIVDLSGRSAFCVLARRGMARVPMKLWLRAWRVG